jgi:uncharacterized protein YndB with AHSA1/START domain
MTPITGSIEISRPPQDVFDYVGDVARHGEWQATLVSVEVESDGPTRVGTKVKETRHVPGGNQTYHYEVTEFDPPRAAGFRVTTGPVRPQGTMTLTPLDEGARTRVEIVMDVKGHGMMGRVLAPLAAHDARKHVPGDLQTLKERLEADS